jgi:hypothetical protein
VVSTSVRSPIANRHPDLSCRLALFTNFPNSCVLPVLFDHQSSSQQLLTPFYPCVHGILERLHTSSSIVPIVHLKEPFYLKNCVLKAPNAHALSADCILLSGGHPSQSTVSNNTRANRSSKPQGQHARNCRSCWGMWTTWKSRIHDPSSSF